MESREWESHPPEEVYEASLCTLVEFPAIEMGGTKGPEDGRLSPCRAEWAEFWRLGNVQTLSPSKTSAAAANVGSKN